MRIGGALLDRVLDARRATSRLSGPLGPEDMVVQSMPDASPVKWHLAHTTWFFDRFVLRGLGGPPVREDADYLFNSYYDAVGSENPCLPAYRAAEGRTRPAGQGTAAPLAWIACGGGGARGVEEIGHDGDGFSFDNERPRHKVYVAPFAIGSRLVTAGEYRAFVADDGYARAELWMAEGWEWARAHRRRAPLYWLDPTSTAPGIDRVFTLDGARPLDDDEPVCHVTWYEADAYARWAGARLPTEAEWEIAARAAAPARDGAFVEDGALHPTRAKAGSGLAQMMGDAWEWTSSACAPYPGFRPFEGDVDEYNRKFMIGQMVLRGGSCATPRDHVRATYRNFFPPGAAWQLTGIRLARDA